MMARWLMVLTQNRPYSKNQAHPTPPQVIQQSALDIHRSKNPGAPRQSPDGVDPDRLKDMAVEALVSDMAQTCPGCHGRISVTKHPPESTSKGSDQRRRISVKDDPGLTS